MAKIKEELLVVKISRLVRDDNEALSSIVTDELAAALEMVASDIFTGSVVEVIKE